MSDYSIVRYRPEALPAVLDLIEAAMRHEPAQAMTASFWRWKHEANPFGPSYGLVAWDQACQQAVGLRVLLRWRFCGQDGRTLRAARAVDTSTHPDYQRRGIFSALTRQAIAELTQEGTDFIFNTPNSKSLPGYLKLGWQVAARWPLYVKPLRPLRMAARRLRPATGPTASSFAACFEPEVLGWEELLRGYGDQLPDLVAGWEAQRRQVGVRTPRDLVYLDWRYGQHPRIDYGFLALGELEQPGRLAALAVLRPNLRFGWQEVVVAEVFLARPEAALGRRLTRRLARAVRSDYLIAHAAAGTVERQVLAAGGFLAAPRQAMVFTTRSLASAAPAAWDLTLGDLEIF